MVSPAGPIVLIALSALTLGSGLRLAEARDMRLRGGLQVGHPQMTGASPRKVGDVPATNAGDSDKPAPNPSTTGTVDHEARLPGVAEPVRKDVAPPSSGEAARITKVAEPWCRSGRISGSGAGFCLIN